MSRLLSITQLEFTGDITHPPLLTTPFTHSPTYYIMSKAAMTTASGRAPTSEEKAKVHTGTFKNTVEGVVETRTAIGLEIHTGETNIRLIFDTSVNPQAITDLIVNCHSAAAGGEAMKERIGRWVSLTNAQTATARKEIEYNALEESLRKLAKERAHAREEQVVSKNFNEIQPEEGVDEPPVKKARLWG